MSGTSLHRFEALAQEDEVAAPLARLYAAALRSAADPAWESAVAIDFQVPPYGASRPPLLHERAIGVESARLTFVLEELARVVASQSVEGGQELWAAVTGGRLDAVALLAASIAHREVELERLAVQSGVPASLLTVVGQALALPVLVTCGRRARELVRQLEWRAGYCPVCGAWPALAELRGLERSRWLRCGRCASEWPYPHQECPFCGNADHHALRYLAEEGKQDTQRVEVCERCRGYLKTFSTITTWSLGDLLLQDLMTVELDLVALDREYQRPGPLGFPLDTRVVPRDREA
ncbi:formate dehydrogenase accessory protein FdhE [Thermomicrobiaceae bacterium CFH 74404]|uniref:Formate dehydrogenase accessory protein FdhE n=1 Tax=Thermalbibacter longus TaxID=2951981 RepID=A0AA41WH03_9BACT|nr:formate dehydrogenase accessory protein FdhE [Thermalbibacter longus]MCM8749938.1 formate dehydrogenase accessory protein FdhE [Thermalbibacter longus]